MLAISADHCSMRQAGYDSALNQKIQSPSSSSYGKIDYTGASNSTWILADLAFGRKDTGRLAIPSRRQGRNKSVSTVLETGTFKLWTWLSKCCPDVLSAAARNSVEFVRGLTGGSGVDLGARSKYFERVAPSSVTRFCVRVRKWRTCFNPKPATAGERATFSFNTGCWALTLRANLGSHAQVGFNYGWEADLIRHLPVAIAEPTAFSTLVRDDGKLASAHG